MNLNVSTVSMFSREKLSNIQLHLNDQFYYYLHLQKKKLNLIRLEITKAHYKLDDLMSTFYSTL